jgi:hypothetical protein
MSAVCIRRLWHVTQYWLTKAPELRAADWDDAGAGRRPPAAVTAIGANAVNAIAHPTSSPTGSPTTRPMTLFKELRKGMLIGMLSDVLERWKYSKFGIPIVVLIL